MRLTHIGFAALLVVGAQQPAPGATAPDASAAAPTTVDVSRLPINLNRINRGLRQSTERVERDGLNLRYTIEVYGNAPRIEFFDPRRDNLFTGPVPHSAPTHGEMLQVMTPIEFRAPVMDFSALSRWLTDRVKK
jgi:hypothetical protein